MMDNVSFVHIDGDIVEMILTTNNRIDFCWRIQSDKSFKEMNFYNVSRLKVDQLSFPINIYEIEIVDHLNSGWGSDSRYEIYDYEDGNIHFYCEDFNINPSL